MNDDLKDTTVNFGFNPFKPKKNADQEEDAKKERRRYIKYYLGTSLVVLAIMAILALIYFGYRYIQNRSNDKFPVANENYDNSNRTKLDAGFSLPEINENKNNKLKANNKVKGELITFADKYVFTEPVIKNPNKPIVLPINIKSDVVNYYDFSRRINLDKSVDKLNAVGYDIIDNPFSKADNFYSAYNELAANNLPQYITSDFLLYYYQNSMKELYRDIRINVFYKDLWEMNLTFFDIANRRYMKTKLKLGDVNSPILEAQRLEALYFAVALRLMKPLKEQTNYRKAIDEYKFSPKESETYDFDVPQYLEKDVEKEIALILHANRVEKSPTLLYQNDYSMFRKIEDSPYEKINNFNLATRWMGSLFPLYAKSETCPDCLLDKNDWIINFITASYISDDFANNQYLQNKWARIYRIMSFFSGLKKELTYLQYDEIMTAEYGKDYNLETIFNTSPNIDDKIAIAEKIRDKINSSFVFLPIEGGTDRSESKNLPKIGMRMLQENFWPDNYFFEKLTGDNTGSYTGNGSSGRVYANNNTTACISGENSRRKIRRCNPTGYDILNILSPIEGNDVFKENQNYQNYQKNYEDIVEQVSKFTANTWHGNSYWTLMGMYDNSISKFENLESPVYQKSNDWKLRQQNTLLGAWMNLRTPHDKTANLWQEKSSSLSLSSEYNIIVEPNIRLSADLLANIQMINNVLFDLQITNDAEAVSKLMLDITSNLQKINGVIKKELEMQEISEIEKSDIARIISKKIVSKNDNKEIILTGGFKVGPIVNVAGVKIMIQIFDKGGRKILVAGPVFSYKESVKR